MNTETHQPPVVSFADYLNSQTHDAAPVTDTVFIVALPRPANDSPSPRIVPVSHWKLAKELYRIAAATQQTPFVNVH